MTAYHIKQWFPLYERSETRKTDYMSWYCKQTKLVGLGIGYTLQQANNLELLGGWYLLEVLASQSAAEHRGWLIRNGKPLTPIAMSSLIPTVKPERFQALLQFFCQPEVDWLELLEWSPTPNLPGLSGKPPGSNSHETAKAGKPLGTISHPADRGQEAAGRNSATDRQTDSTQTDRQTENNKKKAAGASDPNSGQNQPTLAAITASKMQFAATKSRIDELNARGRESWTADEREEWKKLRDSLKGIQKKQRAGKF